MIVATKGTCGGEPRIDNTRIMVRDILSVLFSMEDNRGELRVLFQITDEQISDSEKYLNMLLREKIKM